ncbi:pyridoxamine 5'-phosphate oxidase family protein [Brevibacillus daliensis]|uniref:pyridoxamine 5'-phosphate oxidase family protein n=1 Tax=Brevibacillus daliensis TaxID=2892995 RepID=UPI001E595041|nr:pyridoxamine 5'-phosphate oxidase family protein [Brevibacillus daliensis]
MQDLLFTKVKEIINSWDPAELLAIHCPEDEYHSEIKEICLQIKSNNNYTSHELGMFIHQTYQSYLPVQRNPQAALTFYWPILGRQIRLRGTVEDMSEKAGAADFRQRSVEARAVALTGNQSRELVREEELEHPLAVQRERISRDPEMTAPNWGLYAMNVREAGFWQGDTQRKHTRVQYYLYDGQ